MLTVRSLLAAKPGRHRDERNLYLEVSATSRRWLFRFVSPVTGRATEAGMGVFPEVSLADARTRAAEYRALIAKGIDPIIAKREHKAELLAKAQAHVTLDDALKAYTGAFADKGAPTIELDALVRRHVASLLPRPLSKITTQDVLAALTPVQQTLPKTSARARAGIATVFDYAIARGLHTGANVASASVFRYLLPAAPKSTPYRMCPVEDVPALWTRLREQNTATRLCLAFLLATATRTQEAMLAQWDEISLAERSWLIPAPRIKMRRDFRVPLSDAALEALRDARAMFGDTGYVFKAEHGGRLSPRSLESLTHKTLKLNFAVHGLRASFSTWANNQTSFPHELIEASLAHLVGSSVSRAYNRGDLFARRAALMSEWNLYLTQDAVSNVVQLATVVSA
jgi:integrase